MQKQMNNRKRTRIISIEDALKEKNILFVDVRSPGEYQEDTIPGALNLPILDNEERKVIGTIYRKEGSDAAKMRGFQMKVGMLDDYIKVFREMYDQGNKIVLFCWRGGNRSTYVQAFLKQVGMDVWKLEGGYKRFRKHVITMLPEICKTKTFIVLHGRTGVGKTEILNQLRERGYSVLDLEACAANAGSVFGNIFYSDDQPGQKQFETRLFHALTETQTNYVIVESESKRIGSVCIPEAIYEHMVQGQHYLVTAPIERRVQQTKKDYLKVDANMEAVKEALELLVKRLGRSRVDQMKTALDKGNVDSVIEALMVDYYDPMYDKSIRKYEPYKGEIHYSDVEDALTEIEKIVRKLNGNESV